MAALRFIGWAVISFGVLSASGAFAQGPRPSPTLPLKSVRLYETGVGYFERSGRLAPGAGVTLPVPAGHLDDALKTLVVLSSDKTSVSAIEFASSVSRDRARALAGLPSDSEGTLGYAQLLRSLKGAPVQIRAQRETLQGRLIEVLEPSEDNTVACPQPDPSAQKPKTDSNPSQACSPVRQLSILVLTDHSEVRRFVASDLLSVRPTDPAGIARLSSGLEAVSSRGAQAQRQLHVLSSQGSDVSLGYLAESPVWRSTYRIVFGTQPDQALLQGWALVHNDTDEPWRQVHLELVNGQPQSYLYPLAAPRYARRDLVTPPNQLSTVPQLQDTTVDSLWRGETGEAYGAGGLGLSGTGEGGGGRGEGIGLGSIGTIGHGAGTGDTGESNEISVGNLAGMAQTDAVESGSLFRYVLRAPIDLRAHGSALVPFVYQSIQAHRIAYFPMPDTVAKSALRLRNTTSQTIPPGTLSVFSDGGFAGEALLGRLKPQEAQTISFGTDQDVELAIASEQTHDELRLLSFAADQLTEHFVRYHTVDLEITNRSGASRTVYWGLPYVQNASVKGADSLDFDVAEHKALAVFAVQSRAKVTPTLSVEEGLRKSYAISALSASYLRQMAQSPKLVSSSKTILLESAQSLDALDAQRRITRQYAAALGQLEKDLPRLRANLAAAAPSGSSASEPFRKRMLEAEDRLSLYRKQLVQAQAKERQIWGQFRASLSRLGTQRAS